MWLVFCVPGRCGFVEVRAQVVEAGLGVEEQVPDDNQDGAADRYDGSLLAAAPPYSARMPPGDRLAGTSVVISCGMRQIIDSFMIHHDHAGTACATSTRQAPGSGWACTHTANRWSDHVGKRQYQPPVRRALSM
jgi:hypothetical protein